MQDVLLAELKRKSISADSSIVDLGCGTGFMLRQLADRGFENLTGVDLSPHMLAHAIEKIETAELVEADIESLPFADETFDTVISNAAIQWCSADVAAREMNRVLKPEGRVFASTFVTGTLAQWKDAFSANGLPSRVHEFQTERQVHDDFVQAGFTNLEMTTRTLVNEFDDVDSMFRSIKKLGATNAMQSRPRGMMARGEYRALRQFFERTFNENGKLKLDFRYTLISAQK